LLHGLVASAALIAAKYGRDATSTVHFLFPFVSCGWRPNGSLGGSCSQGIQPLGNLTTLGLAALTKKTCQLQNSRCDLNNSIEGGHLFRRGDRVWLSA
jgi:hypothetical protein